MRGGRGLAAATLLVAVLLPAGCGAQAGAPPAAVPPVPSAVEVVEPPAAVQIPKIGAESSLTQVGFNPDGSMEIPPVDQPLQAAWYRHSQVPGEPGPAVIVGHVDGNHRPGIFHRLRELKEGDEVVVTKGDGTRQRFTVTHTVQVEKDQLPPDVFGGTAEPELRLITCGGTFDKTARSYRDNIVVYAGLAG